MTKKIDSDQNDSLFRELVRGVKPIRNTKINYSPPPPKVKVHKVKEEPERPPNLFTDTELLPVLDRDDLMFFARPGLQHKTLRNFRNGKYNVEAILDLHGKTVAEAQESLSYFIAHCLEQGKKHLLVIHGKGHGIHKPVLKNKLNHWLRQTDHVLAFCSATIRDGHSGSLYVLLKRGE